MKSDQKKYLDKVKEYIVSGTVFNGRHFELYGKNISVFLDHSYSPPVFKWGMTDEFSDIVYNHFGLGISEGEYIWDWYSRYIIEQFLIRRR